MVGIFDNPTDFKLKTNPVYKQIVSPSDSAVSYSFKSVSKGIYAIAVFHDTNENGSLDTKKLGIPSEGVGFSGILTKGIKPPDFEEASFNLVNDTIIAISLKYPRKKGDWMNEEPISKNQDPRPETEDQCQLVKRYI